MSFERKLSILKNVFGNYRKQGDELLFYCPNCDHHKRKLSVNLNKDVAKCWVCKWATDSCFKLVKTFGSDEQTRKWAELEEGIDLSEENFLVDSFLQGGNEEDDNQPSVSLPAHYRTLAKPRSDYSLAEMKYVAYLSEKRGLRYSDFFRWQIGYCEKGRYEGRVIIPSFDKEGEVNYFVARSIQDDYPKYLTPPVPHTEIIFDELYVDWDSPVTLVEGAFDAIKAGKNSIPLLGSVIKEDSKIMNALSIAGPIVHLALDGDAREQELKIARKLKSFGLDVYIVDFGSGDVGEMTHEQFNRLQKRNSVYIDDSFLMRRRLKYV